MVAGSTSPRASRRDATDDTEILDEKVVRIQPVPSDELFHDVRRRHGNSGGRSSGRVAIAAIRPMRAALRGLRQLKQSIGVVREHA